MIKCSFWLAFWGCIRRKFSHLLTFMLDCHSPNEDMFFAFLQTDGADLSASICCFLSILKTTPNISSLSSFYSSRRKCTKRLGACLYALNTFRATSNAIQGRILKFLSRCGEGGPSLCWKSTWGYPLPKITRTLSPRYVTWIMHKMIMFAYTWRNQRSLAFNGQNFRCAVSVSEDYRPYRHISRTQIFTTPGRSQSKTLILSTNADQKSIKRGFLLSFVARLAIVNTVSCDYYPRSSIVKSVFNCV